MHIVRILHIKSVLILLITLIIISPVILAQDDFTVKVGQNETFTEFNGRRAFFGHSPGSTLPFPESRVANSSGNTVHVSLSATPGHEGYALATVGVNVTWDLGDYIWDDIKNWPVDITFNYHYNIESNWIQGNGSANAWIQSISPNGNSLDIYEQIGYEVEQSGIKEGESIRSLNTTLGIIGDRIWIDAFCEAGSFAEASSTHTSSATLQLHSIKIEFLPSGRVDIDEAASDSWIDPYRAMQMIMRQLFGMKYRQITFMDSCIWKFRIRRAIHIRWIEGLSI